MAATIVMKNPVRVARARARVATAKARAAKARARVAKVARPMAAKARARVAKVARPMAAKAKARVARAKGRKVNIHLNPKIPVVQDRIQAQVTATEAGVVRAAKTARAAIAVAVVFITAVMIDQEDLILVGQGLILATVETHSAT